MRSGCREAAGEIADAGFAAPAHGCKPRFRILTGVAGPAKSAAMFNRLMGTLLVAVLFCGVGLPGHAAWQMLRENVTHGSITVMTMTDGTPVTPLNGMETLPTLVIRCYENRTSMYVPWDGSIRADHAVTRYRLDEDPEKTATWDLWTSHTATGSFRASIPLIRALMRHNRLALTLPPDSSAPVSTVFDLSDLDVALGPVRKACKW